MLFDDGRKGQWKKLQDDLQFEWVEGFEELSNHEKISNMIISQIGSKEFDKLKKVMENPLFKMMGRILDIFGLYGTYKGFDVTVFPGTSSSNASSSASTKIYYTHIGLIINRELPFSYSIESKGFFGKLFNKGMKIPDEDELNSLVTIKADDKEMAISYLKDKNRIEAIKKLYPFSKDFVIEPLGIKYQKKASIIPKDEILPILDIMTEAGAEF